MQHAVKIIKISLFFILAGGIMYASSSHSANLMILPGPVFQSATFFGGAGDQRGSAIGINGSDIYIAGYTEVGGLHGLLVKYATPPGSPAWNATLNGTHFLGLGLSTTNAYPVGGAQPPVCGASDGAGDTERKSMLARYDTAGAHLNCGSANFFPYRGHEGYNAALSVVEGISTFTYTGGWAEQTGFSSSFPFVLTKHDAAGAIVIQTTEPGITLGTYGCCPGESNINGLAELNGYIYAAGHSRLPGFGEDGVNRPMLMKYDSSLARIWKVRPLDNPGGYFRAVTSLGGNVYAAGQIGSDGSANYLIEKYDESGVRVWTATSGGAAEDVLTGVVGVGGRLFAVGYTRSAGAGGSDVVLLEIDPATGATIDTAYYGGAQDDRANGVAVDGTDLYIVGESKSFASVEGNVIGQNDVLLLHYSLNQPPIAACQNVTVSAGSDCTADASIDNGSYDPDDDAITVAQSPAGPYPIGDTPVTLTVTDSNGASSECQATVTVVDDSGPTITGVSANPSTLWPPNHKMVDVTINYDVTDNCAASSAITCALSVSSNEPVNGVGDGDSAPDWKIVDSHHVRLRAERAGNGNGRIYTIAITCTDDSGNSSVKTATVTVPKNKN